MKAIFLTLTLSTALLLTRPSTAQDAPPLEGTKAKTGYSAGVKLVEHIQHGKDRIDIEMLIKGIRDAFEKNKLSMNWRDIEKTYADFQSNSPKVKGEKFLEKNASAEGVVVLASGLQYKILKEGSGRIPTINDRVKTHYKGALLDGTEFENTYKDNRPAELGVYQVFVGWSEALELMPVGSKWRLFIPANLAYGAKGNGKKVPPHSAVIFEVELLEVVIDPLKNFQ